jgi:peptidoglycan/LPS O-acetylase OafA/YrhL
MRSERIAAMTGIRPIASLLVFLFHFGRPLFTGAPAWVRSQVGSGFVAVTFD